MKGKMQASFQCASVCVASHGVSPHGGLMYDFKYSFGWGLITAGLNYIKWLWVQGLHQ